MALVVLRSWAIAVARNYDAEALQSLGRSVTSSMELSGHSAHHVDYGLLVNSWRLRIIDEWSATIILVERDLRTMSGLQLWCVTSRSPPWKTVTFPPFTVRLKRRLKEARKHQSNEELYIETRKSENAMHRTWCIRKGKLDSGTPRNQLVFVCKRQPLWLKT